MNEKNKLIQLRVSRQEKTDIQAKAKAQFMSPSEYIRFNLKNSTGIISVNEELKALNYQINHLKINLMQLQSLAVLNNRSTDLIDKSLKDLANLKSSIVSLNRRE